MLEYESFRVALARCLREGREAAGLTQMDMAHALKVRMYHIARVESGRERVSAYELYAWAQLCNLPVMWFTSPHHARIVPAWRGSER